MPLPDLLENDKEEMDVKADLLERIMNVMAQRDLSERRPKIFEVEIESRKDNKKKKRDNRISRLFED